MAREHGLEEIYFADLEVLSILFGIYTGFTVHVYGKKAVDQESSLR